MPSFLPITVRQPRSFDLVDDPVAVSGVGTGFEGVFSARVRDGNGTQLAQVTINAGGTGVWANYHTSIALGAVPPTPAGTLEVYEESAKGDGTELNKVVVPIVFGRRIGAYEIRESRPPRSHHASVATRWPAGRLADCLRLRSGLCRPQGTAKMQALHARAGGLLR
jgi:Immunoglobulin-like domain of bacterial spore germination